MREIKFRAWDGKYKKMHYKVCIGNLHDENNYTAHAVWLMPGDTDYKIPVNGQWMNFDEHSDYTVMQYTGLKDKNGIEIYEGDILEHCFDKMFLKWEVIFRTGRFGVRNIHIDGQTWESEFWPVDSEYYFSDRIIVSNIYSNPELLNQK